LSEDKGKTEVSPAEKIEQLIGKAKEIQSSIPTTTERTEKEGTTVVVGAGTTRKSLSQDKNLKEDILATLTDTKEELLRIIGLLDEKEIVTPVLQILPRYCSYCGRDILASASYCDRCGILIKGA
jgi:hypothetical protein